MPLELKWTCEFCEAVEFKSVKELSYMAMRIRIESDKSENKPCKWNIVYNPIPNNSDAIVLCGSCIERVELVKEEAKKVSEDFLTQQLRKPRIESDVKMRTKERERVSMGA